MFETISLHKLVKRYNSEVESSTFDLSKYFMFASKFSSMLWFPIPWMHGMNLDYECKKSIDERFLDTKCLQLWFCLRCTIGHPVIHVYVI